MRSMNSRCAGGWKRCFIFAAMRYSLMEMDSSFGSSMRRGGVAWSARAAGRAQSRRSMFRSRRWRRPPPRLPVATARVTVSPPRPPLPPALPPPATSSAAASLGRVASVKLFPVVCFKGRGRGSAAPAVRRRRVRRGRGRGGGLYLGKSMGSMVFQSTENMAPWMPLEMSFVPRPRPKMPQTPSLATISLMALVYVIVVSAFVCL